MRHTTRKRWAIFLTTVLCVTTLFGALAYAASWWPGGGSSSSNKSFGHIDINVNLTAKAYINGVLKEAPFTITTADAKYVTITAEPADTAFTLNGNVTTSTESDGTKQIRLEGTFPAGTKTDPVYYTVTLSKTITIDGVEVPVTLATTIQYWDSANTCPGFSSTPNSISGIDLELGNVLAPEIKKGNITLQKNIEGVVPDEPLNFTFALIKPDGETYRDDIKLTIPAGKTMASVIVTNVDLGDYTITCTPDDDVEHYECTAMNFSVRAPSLTSESSDVFINVTSTYTYRCPHNEVAVPETPPTCLNTGLTAGTYCSECGEIFTAQEIIPALGHDIKHNAAVTPSCTTPGYTESEYCTRCDYKTDAIEMPALNHSLSEWEQIKASTCTSEGSQQRNCTRCDYTETKAISPTGHTTAIDAAVDPTCTLPGRTEGTYCSVCEEVLKAQTLVPALGHDMQAWYIVQDATCTELGSERRDCSRCNYFENRVIAIKPHTSVTDKAIAPTCTSTGLTEGMHCSACETVLVQQEVVPALGHIDAVVNIKSPSCTEQGYTGDTVCTRCDAVLASGNIIDALNHNMSAYVITVDPTCTTDGEERSDCYRCEHFDTRIVKTAGHTAEVVKGFDADCTNTGLTDGTRCTACNETLTAQNIIPAKGHDMGAEYITKNPTCEVTGLAQQDCQRDGCQHENTRVLPALGHTESALNAVAPDCTNTGLTSGTMCSTCNKVLTAQEIVPALGHIKTIVGATDADCTDAGYTGDTVCTRCEVVLEEGEELAPLGHQMSTFFTVRKPTCDDEGMERSNCERGVCSYYVTRGLPPAGHNEVALEAKNPTCTEIGLTEGKMCTNCEETLIEQNIIPALGHIERVINNSDPNCTTNGYTGDTVCERCNDTLHTGDIIPMLGHDMGSWYVVEAPECTVDGYKQRDCTRCDYSETNDLSKTGHTPVKDVAKAPTCLVSGLTEGEHCDVCGVVLKKQDTVPALGHDIKLDAYVAPTCTTTGLTAGAHCLRCDYQITQNVIPALNHEYGDWYTVTSPTCTNDGIERRDCARNDAFELRSINAIGHTSVVDNYKAPTCVNTGLTEGSHCETCHEVLTKQDTIPALGHESTIILQKHPTCTETGYTGDEYCARCDTTLVCGDIIPAMGHDMSEAVDVELPTCENTGAKKTSCLRNDCDYFAMITVNANGHTAMVLPAVTPTCTENGLTEGSKCSVCDVILVQQTTIDATGHDLVIDAAKNATCTESGLTQGTHCIRGDYCLEQEIIPAHGHISQHVPGYAATCLQTGLTDGEICSVCDVILTEQAEIAALGHNITKLDAVDATCVNTGLTAGEFCTRCEYKIEQLTIDALGHDMGEWIRVTEPTCTTTGTEQSNCQRCEHYITNTLSALGHKEVADAAILPSCTTDGLTEGYHCEVCEAILTAQEIVPAWGHDLIKDEAIDATCLTDGLSEGEHCSRCDYRVEQAVISALGHDMVVDVAIDAHCLTTGMTEGAHCSRCDYAVAQTETEALGHDLGEWYVVLEPVNTVDGLKERVCLREGCDHVEQAPIPAEIPLNPPDYSNPKTGDNSLLWVWLMLMCMSALGMGITIKARKKYT